jgi:hypothetical protein
MTLKIWEVASWISIVSLKIWKDAAPWIASRVVQLVRTQETAFGHYLRSKNYELAPMIGNLGIIENILGVGRI